MKKNSIILKLQTFFGVTKTELTFLIILLIGLLLGGSYKLFFNKNLNSLDTITDEVFRLNDSLALVQQTTYIGTDAEGNSFEDLSIKDTIVENENNYPQNNTIQLPENRINLNTASKVELMKLPGIGEKTALKIIEFRITNKFNKVEDIKNIKGIGEKKFEKMKQFIDVK